MASTTLLPSSQWASVQWIYDSPNRVEVTIIVDAGGGTPELYNRTFNSDQSVGGYFDTRQFFGSIHRLVITARVMGSTCPESSYGSNENRLYVFRDPQAPQSLTSVGAAFIHVFQELSDRNLLVAVRPQRNRSAKKSSRKSSSKKSSEKASAKKTSAKKSRGSRTSRK